MFQGFHAIVSDLARLLGLILAGMLLFAAPAVATAVPAAGPGDIAVPVAPPPPEPDPNPAVEPGADDIGVEEPCWQTDTCKPPVDPSVRGQAQRRVLTAGPTGSSLPRG